MGHVMKKVEKHCTKRTFSKHFFGKDLELYFEISHRLYTKVLNKTFNNIYQTAGCGRLCYKNANQNAYFFMDNQKRKKGTKANE